jgi:hypothetical protein
VDWFKVTLIILWAALTGLISRSYYLDIKKPKGLSVEVSDFIVIAGCIAGGISSLNLMRLIFFSEQTKTLVNALDVGDIITLVLGPVAVTWVAVRELQKLFKP